MHPSVTLIKRAGARYRLRVEPDGRPFIGDSSPEAFVEREVLRGRAHTAAPRKATPWSVHRERDRAR